MPRLLSSFIGRASHLPLFSSQCNADSALSGVSLRNPVQRPISENSIPPPCFREMCCAHVLLHGRTTYYCLLWSNPLQKLRPLGAFKAASAINPLEIAKPRAIISRCAVFETGQKAGLVQIGLVPRAKKETKKSVGRIRFRSHSLERVRRRGR